MFGNDGATSISITTGTMIRFFLVLIGFYLLWYLRDMFLIILTAIIIASFVESGVLFFKKRNVHRILVVVLIYAFFMTVFSILFYLFAPLLITELYNFSVFLSSYVSSPILDYFNNDAFSGAKDIVNNLAHSLSLTTLLETSKAFIGNLSGGFFQVLSAAFGSIFNVILIILISFYLSIQENGIENFLRIIIPAKHEEYAVDLWKRSRHKIALWVKGQLLLCAIVAILTYLVLSLLGVQYALLLAIIAGTMELVPYGAIVALIPAAYLSFITDGASSAIMVSGAYLIIQQFEGFLLAPLIVGNVVGLSPLVVILAIVIGFELGGIWGLVLAIPVAVVMMEFISDLEKHKIFVKTTKNEQK